MDAKLSKETRPIGRLGILLEWIILLTALALFTITETYQPYVTFGLGLLAVFFAERGLRGRLATSRTGMEAPALLFIASAALATFIAYDPQAALLQFARILAGAALFFLLADSQSPTSEIVAAGFLFATAGLALYWPLKNDFTLNPGKISWITAIGQGLNAHFPAPPGPVIHSNVAAGTLLIGVPFGVALAVLAWRARKPIWGVLAALLTLIILFGLLMTSSRGAWMGLATLILASGLVLAQWRWFPSTQQKATFWIFVAVICLLGAIALFSKGNLERLVGQLPDPSGTMRSRLSLWREGLGLARDYLFTGSGLQTFMMVHATYAILIHSPYIPHVHNSLLEVWIEQGLFGALALVWGAVIVAVWAWRAIGKAVHPLAWAGLAALWAAGVHGLVDVVFYFERTLPLIGLLLGFAALAARQTATQPGTRQPALRLSKPLAGALLALFLISLLLRSRITAAWYANLGALHQTRLELSRYDSAHFDNPTLDQVRQTTDLDAAQINFKKALALQPENLTALQRLSAIALSCGKYPQALHWMQKAAQSGRRDPVTRLLYGDALVANGQPQQAAQMLKELTWAESRLLGQAWYRYWLNQDYQRAADAWQAALLLDPSNQSTSEWLIKARQFLNP